MKFTMKESILRNIAENKIRKYLKKEYNKIKQRPIWSRMQYQGHLYLDYFDKRYFLYSSRNFLYLKFGENLYKFDLSKGFWKDYDFVLKNSDLYADFFLSTFLEHWGNIYSLSIYIKEENDKEYEDTNDVVIELRTRDGVLSPYYFKVNKPEKLNKAIGKEKYTDLTITAEDEDSAETLNKILFFEKIK